MIFGVFVLLTAIVISGVSAFYSITGLTAIFPGAFLPIVIMGCVLELGKIVATVWCHKHWHVANLKFKLYLIPAIVGLMIITSMGTFGYLSSAHLSQSTEVEGVFSQLQIVDERIKTQRDNIEAARAALRQMDDQVNQLLSRTSDDKGAQKAAQLRKQQSKERKQWQNDIAAAQTEIVKLQVEKEPLAAKTRVAESHIGPIKYIAALIYGDNPDANLLERAVRWVIILLVFVFDPLAIVLILAGEQTIKWAREDKKKEKQEAHLRRMQELEEKHQEMLNEKEFERKMAELDRGLIVLDDAARDSLLETIENPPLPSQELVEFSEQQTEFPLAEDENVIDKHPYLSKPWVWGNKEKLPPVVAKVETQDWTDTDIEKVNKELLDLVDQEEDEHTVYTVEERPPVKSETKDYDVDSYYEYLDENVNEEPEIEEVAVPEVIDSKYDPSPIKTFTPVEIPDFSIAAQMNAANSKAGFGTTFPEDPSKGDLYLRVDYLPSKLFRWNGSKWIEADKTRIERFAYDEEYIKHLVDKLQSGEYDVDMLSDVEQEQISRYLNEQVNKQ